MTAAFGAQTIPILLNLVAALVGAFGQYFYKQGAAKLASVPIWKNGSLFIGCVLFCAVMALFVAAYRLGGKMSVVYPFYATTFLWSTALSTIVLGERVTPLQWTGVVGVVFGVAAIAAGQSS